MQYLWYPHRAIGRYARQADAQQNGDEERASHSSNSIIVVGSNVWCLTSQAANSMSQRVRILLHSRLVTHGTRHCALVRVAPSLQPQAYQHTVTGVPVEQGSDANPGPRQF